MGTYMGRQPIITEHSSQQTFTVMFKSLGMTFCAGQYKASSIDSGKYNASNLLQIRHVRNLESAEIKDSTGKTVAMLRIQLYPREIEWITVRS